MTTPQDNRFYREPGAQLADGGPAFPIHDTQRAHEVAAAAIVGITDSAERDRLYSEARAAVVRGMSLRAYAAIELRVPDSGIDWLDAMIRAALHDDLAAKALQGKLADNLYSGDPFETALLAYEYADTMLKARG